MADPFKDLLGGSIGGDFFKPANAPAPAPALAAAGAGSAFSFLNAASAPSAPSAGGLGQGGAAGFQGLGVGGGGLEASMRVAALDQAFSGMGVTA